MHSGQILWHIFDQPTLAMKHAAQRHRTWWIAALFFLLCTVIFTWASAPLAVERANARAAQMIEHLSNRPTPRVPMRGLGTAMRKQPQAMTIQRYWISSVGVGFVLALLGWTIRAALIHFSSAALRGESQWAKTFAVTVWSSIPFGVQKLTQALYISINHQLIEHQGFSFLVSSGNWLRDSRNILYALLSNIDLFSLWYIVLWSIGISAATKVSRKKGLLLAILAWALLLGLRLIPVAISAASIGKALG